MDSDPLKIGIITLLPHNLLHRPISWLNVLFDVWKWMSDFSHQWLTILKVYQELNFHIFCSLETKPSCLCPRHFTISGSISLCPSQLPAFYAFQLSTLPFPSFSAPESRSNVYLSLSFPLALWCGCMWRIHRGGWGGSKRVIRAKCCMALFWLSQ